MASIGAVIGARRGWIDVRSSSAQPNRMIRAVSRWELAALLALLLGSAAHALYFDHIADDAYISFRYAANLAEGHGLVFNPGEYVMGYSNFLWVAVLAAGEWLGVASPRAAPVLGIALGWALLVLLAGQLRSAFGSPWPALAGGLLLATNGTFALWRAAGLEGSWNCAEEPPKVW